MTNDDKFQILRIPDAIKEIPTFSGNKHELRNFIDHVDEVVNICEPIYPDPNQKKIITRTLRSKIKGDASNVLEMYSASGTWQLMKDCLTEHYTDKEDEGTLIKELNSLSQRNDDIDTYFARVSSVVNRLNSWLATHTPVNTLQVVTEAKRHWYLQLALTAFLTGLKEPLATIIRTRDPKTLQAARSHCLAEQNFHIRKNITLTEVYKKPMPPPKPMYHNHSYLYPKPNQPNINYNYKPPIPIGAPHYYNHRPFTNFNPNNHFANNRGLPPKPQPKPEPMDTTSISKQFSYPTNSRPQYNQQRLNFQPTGPPRFQAKELFNMEPDYRGYTEYYDQYPEDYYESQNPESQIDHSEQLEDIPQIEIQDEDFPPEASKPTGT